MFKNILPAKRIPSSDFTMVTSLVERPHEKENLPSVGNHADLKAANSGKSGGTRQALNPAKNSQAIENRTRRDSRKGQEPLQDVLGTDQAFNKLLDELQIPQTLRPKLNGMDATVKSAMLKSSQIMPLLTQLPSSPPTTPRTQALRKARSIESIGTPRAYADNEPLEPPNTSIFGSGLVSAHHSPYSGGSTPRKSSHSRGLSFDAPRIFSRSQVNLAASSTLDLTKPVKEKTYTNAKLSPAALCSILSRTSSTVLDVEDLKKLRILLRNESASWSQEFLKLGGYSALLTRLNEILEVEWREEQHDDQLLHELLRCLKALSTSSIGCFALRSSCPTPFVQLVTLLYSDKKPGDVATRQLIVELLLMLFELYPPSSLPSGSSYKQSRARPHREAWEGDVSATHSKLITLPAPHKSLYSLIRSLLLTAAPPPSESPAVPISPHAFIECLHRPRIYRTYLQELSDVCRDYFWVFCHPNNTIWVLSETDESRVEKPRAPGGMTGGVEFEAMSYFTTHVRLINALAKLVVGLNMAKEHELSTYRYHADLFLSGLERIILISRKASTAYYPTLHLEIARYIDHAVRAGYELPYTVSRLIGSPPPNLSKKTESPSSSSGRTASARPYGSPTKHGRSTVAGGGGGLDPSLTMPPLKNVEPLRFELPK